MAKKPALKDGKYVIQRSRYIDGALIQAAPEFPAVVEVPKGYLVDDGMIPIEKFQRYSGLKPHYVPRKGGHADDPALNPEPTVKVVEDALPPPVPLEQALSDAAKSAKRPSDSSPV